MVNVLIGTKESMDSFRSSEQVTATDGSVLTVERIDGGEYGLSTYIGYIDNEDGILEVEIDWERGVPGVDSPAKNEITFIVYHFLDYNSAHPSSNFLDYYSNNWKYFGDKLAEKTANLKPKVIYDWDVESGSFEDSGEKTERIERDDASSPTSAENSSAQIGACDLQNYAGPEFNTQFDSQCKAAYAYECAGNMEGVAAACAIYEQYQQQSNGQMPDCPYCP
jgi:hypothetical protein